MRNTARGASGYGKSDASLEISQLLGGGGGTVLAARKRDDHSFPERPRAGGGGGGGGPGTEPMEQKEWTV